jgi:hypothetical protein
MSRAWRVVAVGQVVAHGVRIAQRGQVARGVVRVVRAVGMDAAEAWREKRAYAHVSYYLILNQKLQQLVRCAKTLCPLCSCCVPCSCRVHRRWCKSPGVKLTIGIRAIRSRGHVGTIEPLADPAPGEVSVAQAAPSRP